MKYKKWYICAQFSKIPSMKGQPKESRIAYQSDWLEVHEDFMSITEIKNSKKKGNNGIIKNISCCANTISEIFIVWENNIIGINNKPIEIS